MKKIRFRILVLVFLLSLALASVALAQDEPALKRLDIRNNTDQVVTLVLVAGTEGQTTYVLNVPAGSSRVFTVQPGTYAQTTFSCDDTASGTLVVDKNLRFNFTECFGDAPNAGEPSMEKIHIPDSPDGIKWLYQYD